MNESTSLTLITAFLDSINSADREAMLACLSEDVVFDDPDGNRVIGKQEFRWDIGLSGGLDRVRLADIVVMCAQGASRAAAEFTLRGEGHRAGAASEGQSYSIMGGMFFEIDDNLISRVTFYASRSGP